MSRQRARSSPPVDGVSLSRRLRSIAGLIPPGKTVADIGADHALLLISLAKSGSLSKGIAGEVNPGPYHNARERVRAALLQDRIDVRKGDGLSVISPGEADVVVIAGMGGSLIASILEAGKDRLVGVERLVLQPNTGGNRVRRWLTENGWELKDETLVREGGILYEILVAEPGDGSAPYRNLPLNRELLYSVGPLLLQHRHPMMPEKVRQEVEERERILKHLESGRSDAAREKKNILIKEIHDWKRVLQWLCGEGN